MKTFIAVILFLFTFNNSNGQLINYALRISDGITSDTLYFGLDPMATNGIDTALGERELPPYPPDPPVFLDARFTGNYIINPIVPLGLGTSKDYRSGQFYNDTIIYMQHSLKFLRSIGAVYLRLDWWNIPLGLSINIKDPFGGILIDTSFFEDGSFTIPAIYNNLNELIFNVRYEFPLPVELVLFSSTIFKNNVFLNWVTNSEQNNSGFEIQRKSIAQNDWKYVSFVEGRINSNEITNYEYTDRGLSAGNYNYRLKQIDVNGNFEYFNLVATVNIGIPDGFYVSQNYPNPFNPETKINYNIPNSSNLKISLYDMNGKLIKVLENGVRSAGYYEININASDLSSGIYYCNFEYGETSISRKMIVLK